MLSWRGQGKLNIFSIPFPRGVTSAVSEAKLHILAHSSLMQFIFHASSPNTVSSKSPCQRNPFYHYFAVAAINTGYRLFGSTNISPVCNTYLCFIESDCCKRIGKVLSRKLLFSLICVEILVVLSARRI